MQTTSCPRNKKQNIGVRLLRKELDELKKGFCRYSSRTLALARDVESSKGASIDKIIRLERDLRQVLLKLEKKVNCHE
jgi:hypothetical protein